MEIPNNEFRISITSKCNMKCVYCHNEGNEHRSELTIEDIKKLINNAYNLNLQSIRLTGGEPLIHDQIFEICRMIKENYGLRLGINTNGVNDTILKAICKSGFLDRIVFGIDYFDGDISKQSVIGKSSREILATITKIKTEFPQIDLSISTVYDGDYKNIKNLVEFGIQNGIRVKILEEVNEEKEVVTSSEYLEMLCRIIKDFSLNRDIDHLNQVQGYLNNAKVVSFFHSHCRINECDLCKLLSLRVNSDGRIRTCLFDTDTTDYRNGNTREQLIKVLAKN